MLHIENAIPLGHKVSLYIPSDANGAPIPDRDRYVSETAMLLSQQCGGATATDAIGYWESGSDGLVMEKVTIIYAYCDELDGPLQAILPWVHDLKAILQQEAISLEIDNVLYLV